MANKTKLGEDMKCSPDAFILSLFDSEGNYIGPGERKILWLGETIDIDDYAANVGLTLPDSGD